MHHLTPPPRDCFFEAVVKLLAATSDALGVRHIVASEMGLRLRVVAWLRNCPFHGSLGARRCMLVYGVYRWEVVYGDYNL